MTDYDYPDDDLDDLRAEVAHERRTLARYCANPDPRDPDHPEDDTEEGEDE